jgi:hypothetical protein
MRSSTFESRRQESREVADLFADLRNRGRLDERAKAHGADREDSLRRPARAYQRSVGCDTGADAGTRGLHEPALDQTSNERIRATIDVVFVAAAVDRSRHAKRARRAAAARSHGNGQPIADRRDRLDASGGRWNARIDECAVAGAHDGGAATFSRAPAPVLERASPSHGAGGRGAHFGVGCRG